MVALRLPKCFRSFSILQSVIGKDLLSKGSAHFGSPSERQTQHFIESPIDQKKNHICNKTIIGCFDMLFYHERFDYLSGCLLCKLKITTKIVLMMRSLLFFGKLISTSQTRLYIYLIKMPFLIVN